MTRKWSASGSRPPSPPGPALLPPRPCPCARCRSTHSRLFAVNSSASKSGSAGGAVARCKRGGWGIGLFVGCAPLAAGQPTPSLTRKGFRNRARARDAGSGDVARLARSADWGPTPPPLSADMEGKAGGGQRRAVGVVGRADNREKSEERQRARLAGESTAAAHLSPIFVSGAAANKRGRRPARGRPPPKTIDRAAPTLLTHPTAPHTPLPTHPYYSSRSEIRLMCAKSSSPGDSAGAPGGPAGLAPGVAKPGPPGRGAPRAAA